MPWSTRFHLNEQLQLRMSDGAALQTACLLSNTERAANSLQMFLGSHRVLLQSKSWFVTPELQDVSANNLLCRLLCEMWVSDDLRSRMRWWKGTTGDRTEGYSQECRVRKPRCLLLSIGTELCFWIKAGISQRLLQSAAKAHLAKPL